MILLPLLLALVPVPPLSGPVVDAARMVDPASTQRLDALARAARSMNGGRGVQLQVLTVPSLDDEPIEDFSIRVAEAWKIGTKGQDNGLLFVVAQQERKFRLEVGGGLEGDLTDIQAEGILDTALAPAFRRGDYGGGLYAASLAALDAVHGLPADTHWAPASHPIRHGGLLELLLLIIVVVLMIRFPMFFLGMLLSGRSSGSGGGGFGGGGGGGWSGGGGGFSGGGASGGW